MLACRLRWSSPSPETQRELLPVSTVRCPRGDCGGENWSSTDTKLPQELNLEQNRAHVLPEFVLTLFVEAVDEAVGLALQRPPQGDATPATERLRVPDETLHGLRQGHELRRTEPLQ